MTTGQKRAISQSKAARIQDSKRPNDQHQYLERLRHSLKFLNYAPALFISASTGKNVDKIFPLIEEVATERRKRITTGEMNRFLKTVDFERASVPMRQRVRILYLTQAAVAPPTFILFTDRTGETAFFLSAIPETRFVRRSALSARRSGLKFAREKPSDDYFGGSAMIVPSMVATIFSSRPSEQSSLPRKR